MDKGQILVSQRKPIRCGKTDLCGVLPISLWFEGDFACLGLH